MYDIIIIGAGTAGISAYKEAIKHTQNILIINDGSWDTTCARVGCMPSKILISTANRMHGIQQTDQLGLKVAATIDTSGVMPYLRQLRDRFTSATLKDVASWNKEHKISGQAQFIDSQTIVVNQTHYQAKSFIIAVGSTPNMNKKYQDELGDRYITSDQIFELETLPQSLAVIGSGVIALELAQAMQRLNVKTTVFARSKKVGSLTSSYLQTLAQQELSKELNFKFEILPTTVKADKNKVVITFNEHGQEQSIEVDYLLSATGRSSHLDTLHLEQIESTFKDLKQLPVNMQTKQLGKYPIFIIGDAYTTTPIQHEAAHEGREVIDNCLNYPQINSLKTLTPLSIVFSQPEMAIVGQSFKQLTQSKIDFVTGMVSYEKQGRALVLGENKGAVEVYIHKITRKLLGSELLVHSAEHMAHLLSWILSEDLTVDELLDKEFYHPTLEEGLRTAFKHARRQLDD